MSLLESIENILSSKGSLTAKDILKHLLQKGIEISKTELNSILYQYNKLFHVNADFAWALIKCSPHTKKVTQNIFKVEGKLKRISDLREGNYQGRKWQKQKFLIECLKAGNNLSFTDWNGKLSLNPETLNDMVKVSFIIRTKITGTKVSTFLIAKMMKIIKA